MVDAHFGIGGRQVDKYIMERDLGVICPDDIAEALIHYGGIKGTAVDFVKVNRNSLRIKKWFVARDGKTRMFDSIGKPADIMFEEMRNGYVHVRTQKYSGAKRSHYIMEEFKILYAGEYEKDVMDDTGQDGVVISNEERNDVDLYLRYIVDSEANAIADDIAGGRENRTRRETDDLKFSMRPALGYTPYTASSLKFMSGIK